MDSDDCWRKDKLFESIKYLDQGNDLVYHDCFILRGSTLNFKDILKTRELGNHPYNNLLINGNGIICSSVVMRSSITKKVGYFDEDRNCIAGEDYDYWLRVAKQNYKFQRLQETFGEYREHKMNISSHENNLRFTQYLYHKYLTDINKVSRVEPEWVLKIYIFSYYHKKQYYNTAKYLLKYIKEYPLNSLKKLYYKLMNKYNIKYEL